MDYTYFTDQRNACRACRFSKCEAAGMKRDSVQSERDQISSADSPNPKMINSSLKRRSEASDVDAVGSRLARLSQHPTDMSEGSPSMMMMDDRNTPMSSPECATHNPILQMFMAAEEVYNNQMRETVITSTGYATDNNQMAIHGMRVAATDDITDSMKKQLLLMVEWAKGLKPFENMKMSDQITLLRNYSAQHLLICCAFRSRMAKYPDMVYLTNSTVLTRDTNSVHDVNDVTKRILDELVLPMKELEVTQEEYVALKGITLFNPTTQGLQDGQSVGNTRMGVLRSLEQHMSDRGCFSLRMAQLLLILPSLQAISQGLLDDIHLATLFGMARIDSLLHELLPFSCQSIASMVSTPMNKLTDKQEDAILKFAAN